MRRACIVSMDSPGRGSGLGGGAFAGDVVEAICSGVWGIDDQRSFRLTNDVERGPWDVMQECDRRNGAGEST